MNSQDCARMKAHTVMVDIEGMYYEYHNYLTAKELRDVQDARLMFQAIMERLRRVK